jgi:two-component system chemotaxis response regulator CheY
MTSRGKGFVASPTDTGAEASVDVLVVEDEEAQREAVVAAVRALGYPVRSAPDARAALQEHECRPAAIVLTDWSMPGVTGLDLCVALKRLPSPPHVVLMSGYRERERLLHALRAGADEFIAKPIDLEELEVRLLASTRMVNATRALERQKREVEWESARRFEIARTDPLTAIPNRRRMDEDLSRARDEATRYGRRYCLALCDIDHFKRYNDQHGHLNGDTALQRVAVLLRDGVRASDTVYRYGGEEFVVLFPEQSAKDVAEALDRVRAALQSMAIDNRGPGAPDAVLTISAGVAEIAGSGVVEWLARADAALYRAKAAGRNRVIVA